MCVCVEGDSTEYVTWKSVAHFSLRTSVSRWWSLLAPPTCSKYISVWPAWDDFKAGPVRNAEIRNNCDRSTNNYCCIVQFQCEQNSNQESLSLPPTWNLFPGLFASHNLDFRKIDSFVFELCSRFDLDHVFDWCWEHSYKQLKIQNLDFFFSVHQNVF